jgi:hypothetical protein
MFVIQPKYDIVSPLSKIPAANCGECACCAFSMPYSSSIIDYES